MDLHVSSRSHKRRDHDDRKVWRPKRDYCNKADEKNKLPDGWLDCPSYGQNIDYIIPSKVPIGDSRYSPRDVIHEQAKFRRQIGLVIDLTDTTRYYQTSEWLRAGIQHVKIACKERGSVPGNQAVNDFIYEVLQFYSRRNQSDNKYILVHCTHGFNLTGYMSVHFLVRSQSISVSEALLRFSTARSPGIYKQEYIDELYMFYGERRPESVICPPIPEWKSSDEDADAFRVDEVMEDRVMTNDDVIGEALPFEEQNMLRKSCYELLKLSTQVNGSLQFPGSHPVSLNRDNIKLLWQLYYYVTWKADGTRYMMLITGDGCYLIDRKFCFRRVRMRFPLKSTNQGFDTETHNFTLLDGEMVIETMRDSQELVRRFLIYDAMAINNVSLVDLAFYERWNKLKKEVIEPRNIERQVFEQSRIPCYRYDMEPFSVRKKDFWVLSAATKILKSLIPNDLSHEADGLIFQGWDDPYVPRTHDRLLKWKYMDSVDFLFEVTEDNRQLLFLNDGRRKRTVEGRVVFENESDPAVFSGNIIECTWDSKRRVWVYLRVRTDKSKPNEFNTYVKVMRSIKDNITEDVLLNEIYRIVRLPMYADRIRNDSEAHTQRREQQNGVYMQK